MVTQYLIINLGSRSKKFALYSESGELLRAEHLEGERYREAIPAEYFAAEPAVGIRIVAPGKYFLQHRLIDQDYLAQLERAAKLTPLHLGPALAEIKVLRENYPNLPLYGISDSAYYRERPLTSRLYGLPAADAEQLGLYRYGYHGLSVASVMRRLGAEGEGRVIVCHLGGGISVVGLKAGAVVDTSMGFTPLEGPIMSTRVGRIDAGALLALMKERQMTTEECERYLYEDCGLLGVSGTSEGVRELLEAEGDNPQAKQALELLVWGLRREVGAMVALLGGLDTLVLTGTIAERSAPLRDRLIEGLAWLQSGTAPAKVLVMASDEQAEIQRLLKELL